MAQRKMRVGKQGPIKLEFSLAQLFILRLSLTLQLERSLVFLRPHKHAPTPLIILLLARRCEVYP